MDLTDEEAVEAFRFLVAALRTNQLGWVVTQVEEKLALGKVQPRKLRARDVPELSDELWEVHRQSEQGAKRSLFAVAEPHSPQERLEILLESISIAVPRIHQVAKQVFANLADIGIEGRLTFEPEAEVSEAFSFTLAEIEERAAMNKLLLDLITELRGGPSTANTREPAR